jgi:hypothetical protein
MTKVIRARRRIRPQSRGEGASVKFLLSFPAFFPLLAASMFSPVSLRKARLAWQISHRHARGFAGDVVTL